MIINVINVLFCAVAFCYFAIIHLKNKRCYFMKYFSNFEFSLRFVDLSWFAASNITQDNVSV